jgi:RNA polymerase sigma factor (sigma-70 family)
MEEILIKLKKKDEQSVAWIYTAYGKKLYGYAVSKWNLDEDSAWELVYKTLYKVVEVNDRYKFENENKFCAWMFKIFINYLRNHYRDTKNKHPETVELTERLERTMTGTEEIKKSVISSSMKCLQEELQKLEDWERIVLLMRAQDFSYEEIGQYVNKPVEQLKVYYMRLKKKITEGTNNCIENKQ